MRIDAHQHFWKYDPQRDSWITSGMEILKRNFLPEDLRPELEKFSVDGCIAVQASQSVEETRYLLELAASHPFVAGVVGWTDLCSARVEEHLADWSRHSKLRGFRHIVQSEPDERFMLKADFQRGISVLAQFGFVYDILIYPKQLPAAIELVQAHPKQIFVLDHLAKPEVRRGHFEPWERGLRELAENPSVFCKISGLITEANWESWQDADFRKYLDVAFDAFGCDRLMFGSDWPVCLLAGSYERVVMLLMRYVRELPETAVAAIFGDNAARCYGLKAA